MLAAALKVFSLVSSQQMKDSTISSARTTIAAAAIIKHNFVKLGNTKPPWHFGLASHSLHVLSMVLGSLSTLRTQARAESQRFPGYWLPNGTSHMELSPCSQIHIYHQLVSSRPKVLPLPVCRRRSLQRPQALPTQPFRFQM